MGCFLSVEVGSGVWPICHEVGNTAHSKCQLPHPCPYPHTTTIDSVKSVCDVVHM
jgi:hypothetical protein